MKPTRPVRMELVEKLVMEYKGVMDAQAVLNKREADLQGQVKQLTPEEYRLYFEGAK